MIDQMELQVGQTITTIGRQITVPDWYELWMSREQGFVRIADMPIIRLKESLRLGHGFWNINTNNYNQAGLVCFVPEVYLGTAILSVSIVAVREKSVVAQPIEWIELNPKLDASYIGKNAQEIYDLYQASIHECYPQSDGQIAIWHNKQIVEVPD